MKEVTQQHNKKNKKNERGTTDELEVLKIVISEHRGLFLRVLDKIRQHKALMKENPFDEVKKKQEQSKRKTS